ncbi:MAG: hypothetical protein VB089_03095 [Anaerolineaceae bacterium]|jgi:hypothetical protein|nr:hypothetical protein [Anaerolineaceae bacterium]
MRCSVHIVIAVENHAAKHCTPPEFRTEPIAFVVDRRRASRSLKGTAAPDFSTWENNHETACRARQAMVQ